MVISQRFYSSEKCSVSSLNLVERGGVILPPTCSEPKPAGRPYKLQPVKPSLPLDPTTTRS